MREDEILYQIAPKGIAYIDLKECAHKILEHIDIENTGPEEYDIKLLNEISEKISTILIDYRKAISHEQTS